MDSFNDVTDQLINKLCLLANGKTQVSMHKEFSLVALDTIGKVRMALVSVENVVVIYGRCTHNNVTR